ncbi:hydroxymethylbilane synthase [Pseudoclavibacter soli]|uniref:hydroxymethylbilane synthase n=1 Tax=Pseudoclavibacter soli TaxID=452623 RepID=UPI0004022F5E|nr:hydroxymethylbilane synthase [Pseudoclavibacter soli]
MTEQTAPLRLGTRGSRLAVAQSQQVADALTAATGRPVELVRVVTHGDVNRASLSQIGGVGVFATALREGLVAGEYDLVVHSFKDLPTAEPEQLEIAAVPLRADARDVLVSREARRLADLPAGARVGTGSTRRQAQLRRQRPDIEVVDIRGNIDTRLRRLDDDLDGVILAAAGLDRLETGAVVAEYLPIDQWIVAPAQGALAVETRRGDRHLALVLDHAPTRMTADLERAVLAGLGAGCAAPVGVHARVISDAVHSEPQVLLEAVVYDDDDFTKDVRLSRRLTPPAALWSAGDRNSRVAPGTSDARAGSAQSGATPGGAVHNDVTVTQGAVSAAEVSTPETKAPEVAAQLHAWAAAAGSEIAQHLIDGGADRIIAAAEGRREQ